MTFGSLLRRTYLLRFAQPAGERPLYRAIQGQPVGSIVEIGIGLTGRTQRMLEVASWRKHNLPLRYTGIDLFEARPRGQPGLSLKQAFASLRLPNIRVQLAPGTPEAALQRVANSLIPTDVLLIAADQDRESLAQAWTWMPRMLTTSSLIFLEEPAAQLGPARWRSLRLADVQLLAAQAAKSTRRAA